MANHRLTRHKFQGYEQGALVFFTSDDREMIAIVREKRMLAIALEQEWSLQKFLNEGYTKRDLTKAVTAAKALEALIPEVD